MGPYGNGMTADFEEEAMFLDEEGLFLGDEFGDDLDYYGLDDESDEFSLRGIGRFLKKAGKTVLPVVKAVAPIAKKLAPAALGAIGTALGGPAGGMIGSKVGGLLANLEDEGEGEEEGDSIDEYQVDEAELYLDDEADGMAEAMADAAARTSSISDAQALAGALTVTITSNAPIQVKKVAPTLASAAGRVAKVVSRHPRGKLILKTLPTIQKRTVATLQKKAEKGKTITPTTAKRAMARHTARVLRNTNELAKAMAKNEGKKRAYNQKAIMRAEKFA